MWTFQIIVRPFPRYSGTPRLSSKELGQIFLDNELIPLYKQRALETLYSNGASTQPNYEMDLFGFFAKPDFDLSIKIF
jgi:hypothetical protein